MNTIPSLFINQVSKDVDTLLKAPLIAETFNICGHHISAGVATKYKAEVIKQHLPGFQGANVGYDHRMYCNVLSEKEKLKQQFFSDGKRNDFCPQSSDSESDENDNDVESDYASDYEEEEVEVSSSSSSSVASCQADILSDLTPCDLRVLMQAEEELSQTETFERIFPTDKTSHYLQFTSNCNYYDVLLSAWEHKYSGARDEGIARLSQCSEQKIHLQVPQSEERMTMPQKTPILYKRNLKVPHIFEKR